VICTEVAGYKTLEVETDFKSHAGIVSHKCFDDIGKKLSGLK
jgi:hypothetical protein